MHLEAPIERFEDHRRDQAPQAGIRSRNTSSRSGTPQGPARRPKLFFARHGAGVLECCTVAIGKGEALLGKAALDDCCEVEVKRNGGVSE